MVDIDKDHMAAFLAWQDQNVENGITTWSVVEGSPEEKVQAIFDSTAFWINIGDNPTEWHSVQVDGEWLSYVDPEDTVEDEETELEVPSGDRVTMTRQDCIDDLVEKDNPEVQVCYKEGI